MSGSDLCLKELVEPLKDVWFWINRLKEFSFPVCYQTVAAWGPGSFESHQISSLRNPAEPDEFSFDVVLQLGVASIVQCADYYYVTHVTVFKISSMYGSLGRRVSMVLHESVTCTVYSI